MKIAATLACRAESSRLYAKPMQPVGDRPILLHLIDRLRRVKRINEIVLAIAEGPSKEVFADFARSEKLPYVVGSQRDVLGRLIAAADSVFADVAVRVTTENPYIYWEGLDELIRSHLEREADLSVIEGLPLGATVEVVNVPALLVAAECGDQRHHEHCTMYLAEHPEKFVIQRAPPPRRLRRPDVRLTVDTPEDLMVVRAIWEHLHRQEELISIEQIVAFLDEHPELTGVQHEQSLHLWK